MVNKVDRVTSGIPGLDKLIEGGFVKNSANLVAGTTGSAKTIFCCQYILEGLKKGENCLYLTLEQPEDDIMQDVSRFGWDAEFKKYIQAKKLMITSTFPTSVKELSAYVLELVKRNGVKRFALDSLSIASMSWKSNEDEGKLRVNLFDFMKNLKKTGVTSLLITEIPEEKLKALSRFGFEEFLADSIIILHYLEYAAGGTPRSLAIRKMRRTDHGNDIYPMVLTKDGIKITAAKKDLVL